MQSKPKSPRLYQEVAAKILEFIAHKRLPPGTNLPNERDFALLFSVSRTTVREAEVALEAAGRIVVIKGRGTFVGTGERPPSNVLDTLDELELLEARQFVEAQTAALAARNIASGEIGRLELLAERSLDPDWQAARDAQQAFYRSLAQASQNTALAASVDQLVRSQYALAARKPDGPQIHPVLVDVMREDFPRVLRAVEARDPCNARTALSEHFGTQIEVHLDFRERASVEAVLAMSRRNRARFMIHGSGWRERPGDNSSR